MTDREQMIEHEKDASPLPKKRNGRSNCLFCMAFRGANPIPDRMMNVESPAWASVFSKANMPLGPALRAAFQPSKAVPIEFQSLLSELEGRLACRKPGHQRHS